MNIAIILSGGQGCRMDMDIPKQYIEIDGSPIIAWCLETFVKHRAIDALIIVLDPQWQTFVASLPVLTDSGKPIWYAPSGDTRQQSIYNGLKRAKECGASDEDIVVIHDGVRPLVDEEMICGVLDGCRDFDGAIASVAVKDNIYVACTEKRGEINDALWRRALFTGQTPEAYRFGKYLEIHERTSDKEIAVVTGGAEFAFRHGLKVTLTEGKDRNLKLTVPDDLEIFKILIRHEWK